MKNKMLSVILVFILLINLFEGNIYGAPNSSSKQQTASPLSEDPRVGVLSTYIWAPKTTLKTTESETVHFMFNDEPHPTKLEITLNGSVIESGSLGYLKEGSFELISNKSAEWINISLPDKLAQVQVINDNILCLFKDNSLRIYNLKLKDWKEVNNRTSISMLLKDHVNFYAFSEETGEVSVIMNGGDATGWTLGNIYKMEEGYLTSVKSCKGNIFLASVPIYLWKPLK
ncbi:hypothetical protein [Paenibacillus azoreducens]|uniref:Uncharacterized protein n=1 Tax=Paenibacillus azoreducens TaxID=116718 RepID=A0A919YBA5_9BACL|nr:hypothetical protein [Paenibacillus azoreducens]GIO48441.1 hypothetical protein J34TS1_32060 [Paenibacillus azoreducens]